MLSTQLLVAEHSLKIVSLPCSQNLTLVACPELAESSPHNVSLKSILILYSNLWLDLPYDSCLRGFLTNILYGLLNSSTPCPSHPPWYNHLTILSKGYELWTSPLCSFLHPPVTSCLIGPNIVLSVQFSDTLNCISLRKRLSFTPVHSNGKCCMSLWCSSYTYWPMYLRLLLWSSKCHDLLLDHELCLQMEGLESPHNNTFESPAQQIILNITNLTWGYSNFRFVFPNLFLLLAVCLLLKVIWCFEVKSIFYFMSEINTKKVKWYIYLYQPNEVYSGMNEYISLCHSYLWKKVTLC